MLFVFLFVIFYLFFSLNNRSLIGDVIKSKKKHAKKKYVNKTNPQPVEGWLSTPS